MLPIVLGLEAPILLLGLGVSTVWSDEPNRAAMAQYDLSCPDVPFTPSGQSFDQFEALVKTTFKV